MVKPELIVRTNRRSLSLNINASGELIVKAPKRMDIEDILNFIKQKEEWITSKQKMIKASLLKNEKILNGDIYLFCGKEYKCIYVDKQKEVEVDGENFTIPRKDSVEKEIYLIKKWYLSSTKQILQLRVNYFANLMQINYDGLGIDNSKIKWGSCSKSGIIKFNLRLSMLPHKIIDYIIIHELSHLLEFNHSKNFYQIIGSVMPDWQIQRNKLKEYGYLLKLLR